MGHRSPPPIPAAGCVTPPRHNVYSTRAASIRMEVPRIPHSLQESLEALGDDALLELARAHGVESADPRARERMVQALLGLPVSAGVAAEADRLRIESRLDRLRPRQLRELGERHQVSLQGLKKKSELVEALAGSKDSSDILVELEAIPEKEPGFLFGKETGPDVERVEAASRRPGSASRSGGSRRPFRRRTRRHGSPDARPSRCAAPAGPTRSSRRRRSWSRATRGIRPSSAPWRS